MIAPFFSPRAAVRAVFAAASLLTVSASVAYAQQPPAAPAQPAQTYSLQRVFKAGDVDTYNLKINQKITGGQFGDDGLVIKISMTLKETTKSVSGDGLVTIIDEFPKADGEINGMAVDLAPMMPKITVTKDKTGKIEATHEGGNDQVADQMIQVSKQLIQASSSALPKKPVKIGDSWPVDMSAISADEKVKTVVTVKLDGVETISGAKALRLKSTTEATGGADGNTKIHGEATTFVSQDTGKALRMESTADGTAGGNKISVQLTMERSTAVPDGKPVTKDPAPK